MAYQKQTWTAGDAITKQRMDHIEDGIYDASLGEDKVSKSAVANRLDVNTEGYVLDARQGQVLSGRIADALTAAQQAQGMASAAQQGNQAGTDAKTQIIAATTSATPNYESLAARFDAIDKTFGIQIVEGEPVSIYGPSRSVASVVELVNSNAETILREVENARTNNTTHNTYDSLTAHLDTINSSIATLKGNVADINAAAGTGHTLVERINQLQLLQDEVDAARREVAEGAPADTLAARFVAIEQAALDLASTVATLDAAVVKKGDVRDNFTSNDTNLPLSALKGKELRQMIGGSFDATNTVANAIINAQNTAQDNATDYADDNKVDKTSIYNDLDQEEEGYVLDARQGKTLDDKISEVNTEIGDIQDELTAAHTSSVVRTMVPPEEEGGEVTYQDTTYGSLDARLEAIETHAAAARSDLDEIANELSMFDIADNITGAHSRIDQLEENMVSMANEIGMFQNGAAVQDMQSAITGVGTRIDAIETELDQAHRDSSDTLDARFDDIEAAISHPADPQEEDAGGLTERLTAAESSISTLNSDVSDLTTELGNVRDKANSAATQTQLSNAIDTINNSLSNNSTTIVLTSNDVNFDEDGITPTTLKNNVAIVDNNDYIIENPTDNKYYYWKHISNAWHLMGGAGSGTGGGGSSSGEFAASLESITEPDINTDYFVGNNNDGYLHYRYIEQENSEELEPVLIGVSPDNIKRYNIERVLGKKREYNSETQQWEETDEDVYYLNLYEFDYGASNAQSNIEESMVPIGQIELPQGGGGGSTISTTPRVVRITPSTVTTVQNDEHIYLRFFYAAVDATGESFDSTYTLKYNNSSIISSGTLNSGAYDQTVTTGVWPSAPRPVGFYEIDVTEYCRLGSQTFNLVVAVNGQDVPRAWTVNILELRLESSAPQSQLIEVGDTIQFPYTPYGAMTKTLYVRVDGNVVRTQSLSAGVSGSELEVTIPSQTHGAHTISINLEASLDGATIPTLPVSRDYIWYDASNTSTPIIIASPYRDTPIEVEQYAELQIPYTIYNKNAATSTVKYYVGEDLVDTVNISNSGTFSYVFEDFGEKEVHITVDDVSLDFDVTVTEIKADVAQVAGAVINFDPSTLTNTSANRLPTWTYNNETYHMTVSDNFNWSNDASGGGYKEDIDGKCFVVKAGTYAYFDYKMFKMAVNNSDPENPIYTSSAFDKGAEMKVIFKVSAVRDASAVWFTNVGNPSSSNQMPIGIQLSAHQGWLKTSAADAAEKQAQREGTVASTNSYLYFPYSEEDKIELDISINRTGTGEDFIMSYEDGVPSKAYAYETTEILYHEPGNESVIRIGSPDCDVYIYKFRVYDKGLGTSDILRNFIADGKTVTDKVNRYNRNSIYYDSTKPVGQQFTPYKTGSAVLDPEKLAEKMPDVKILMLEADTFTKDKNTFVNSSLRCIHADGGTVYPSRGDEDNWLFRNGLHSGQGTTSDNYGQSSRNVDFLFMCDGTHAPTKKKNITNDQISLVSNLVKGRDKSVLNPTTKSWTPTVDATVETCSDWKGDDAKVSLTSTSIPNNYFNLKVNVASSENVNNALFQKRYNDFLRYVYESPAYKRDNRIKNDMEFVPAILFVRETNPTKDENNNYTNHLEFNDTDWHFYSLGNIGDSKKTDYTRAYDPTDMNEFTVEISDNNTSNSQFQSGVYVSNNERIIEESDSGINSMNYIWDIDMDTEWNAMRDPTEREIEHDAQVAAKKDKYLDGTDLENAKTSYILPNGKVYVNYRHRMLSGDPFDGKHSFEFRYACTGDYRDGDLINDTHGKNEQNQSYDELQFNINRAVVEAFYTWIVTASNEEFEAQLAEWCVPEAVEFFYAFTHFYTMMDNRAKNCFWHFGKTGTHRQVHTPYKELLHVYDELNNGVYERTEDTEIDPQKTYYTEYAFDLWAYDMDTAAGIDNNGELVFPYGKEDTDYRQAGISSSGYVFNGAGSIIWRRLSTSFTDEIADIFNRVNEAACFDAMNLINQFDTFQSCYPEEMWRLDIERKYIRTFTGKVYDNCKLEDASGNTKQNTRFLKEMMQGRKKYQRRQWVRDQAIYFGSKYMLNNIRNNTIEMVCYTPDAPLWNSQGYEYKENDVTYYRPFVAGDFTFYGSENNRKLYKCIQGNADSTFIASKWAESVTPDYKLKLVPYQDMYLNVAVGNGNLRAPVRAVAGQEYTIDCTANMNETRVYIYAGSYIQAISGLAPFYIGANIFSSAARLKKLDLGTDNPNYHNTNLNTLTILPHMPILEELNIKNCDSLNTPINLSESNNLKIVEAEGSVIPSLSLPAYTAIETLHLPSTVNTLTLQSARKLTSFYMKNKETGLEDYSSLINMNISDSDYSNNINWIEIGLAALQHLNSLYLRDLNQSSIQDITDLEPFAERKEELETQYDEQGNLINKVNLSGLIHVLGSWSTIEIENYLSIWPNIQFDTISTNEVTRYKIIYKYDDYIGDDGEVVEGTEIKTLYIRANTRIPDIAYGENALIDPPTRNSTVRYSYTFGEEEYDHYVENSGWKAEGSDEHFIEMPLATRNMVIETYFTKTARRYQTKWFMKRGDASTLVKTSAGYVEYGGGSDLEAPTVQEIHAAGQQTAVINNLQGGIVNYSIFKGWETLPIEIHPSANDTAYNIYADWETREVALGELFSDTTSPTPEQLFVYAHMSSEDRRSYAGLDKFDLSQQISFTLGHDSIEEGQMLIGPGGSLVNGILRLDVTPTPRVSTIQPMREGNDAFTIMIDYSFNPNNPTRYTDKSAGILMSCYYYNSNTDEVSGFALYDNLNSSLGSVGPRIGFGKMFNNAIYSQAVGGKSSYHEARNVLVLRHPAGSSTLHVYSGLTSDNKIALNIATMQLSWNNSTNNAYINFGQLTNATDDDYNNLKAVMATANGTIYQAKYWSKDLGVGECKRLAAWPHETVTFGLAKIYNNATNGSPTDNNPAPALGLNTLTTSSYGHLSEDTSSLSWGSSTYRTIMNNHVVLGLPTKLQAILNKPKVKYLPLTVTEDEFGGQSRSLATIANSQNDYLFFPSIYNLDIGYSKYLQETNAVSFDASPYPWISSADIVVYDYNTSGTVGSWNIVTNADTSHYTNLRFSIHPLAASNRIFRETTSSFSNGNTTTIQTAIETGVANISSGDIFIDITGKSYMYVSNNDINQLGAQVLPNTGIFRCNSGGWIQGSGFWTRSMMEPDMFQTNAQNHMIYSNKNSTIVTAYNSNNAVSSSEGLGLNYSITI